MNHGPVALVALTPEPKRGRRQIRDENPLRQRPQAIVDHFQVSGLLGYTFTPEETLETPFVGRGRGGPNRPAPELRNVLLSPLLSAMKRRLRPPNGVWGGDSMPPIRIQLRTIHRKAPLLSYRLRLKLS